MKKLRIVVGGFIGLYPTGGVTWDYIQYVIGLQQLGHDVFYLEDTCQFPKFQSAGKEWNDPSDSIEYLKNTMEKFGLQNRWAYRDVASGNCFGMSLDKIKEICRTADVFINISASTFLRDEYLAIPKRVLIDSDPMFTQVDYLTETGGKDPSGMKFILDNHNYHFSFGENIGQASCRIPLAGFNWHTTRQPICIDCWNTINPQKSNIISTVMNWSVRPDLIFDNENWGQKNIEFKKFIGIPKLFTDISFEIIITGLTDEKRNEIKAHGWNTLDPLKTITDTLSYKEFITTAMAEFSVAKHTYVKSNSGWFSCRSACYLAAGKPVIAQDTQWSKYIPTGNGLFAFTDTESIITSVNDLKENYMKHSKAAIEIAREYFDSNKILNQLLEKIS
ncbi:hypothetical protein LK994_04255 [Ferruginibacter lapsinanis]|uniref:glycosyltransferase n=1 Tax=Ferruginibacter lapsinanis TaxID=563172 RepID=UPI001E3689AC|nr:hypothetical protein [Ferruginibacter lapsinanis]UEG50684.1 hypothetical protein LK994_04255 [Ferruginibacter lapsinanis]